MDPNDREQTELLRHIWNEMKALGTHLGGRIDTMRVELKSEIGQTNQRLDELRVELKGELAGLRVELRARSERPTRGSGSSRSTCATSPASS
jgi:hypothetical protein